MVTYSTMREVGLWVQLTQAGGAQVEYWEKGRPQRRWRTVVVLSAGPDHVVELVADSVRPGQKYSYRLWAADLDHIHLRVVSRPYPLEFQSQALWQGRTDPPNFRVALGSGAFVHDSLFDAPGEVPSSGQYSIFSAIDQQKPDLMVWLGDNVCLRPADWDSPASIWRRYAHTRALGALQPLLGSVHHYATWDDADYGPPDAGRAFSLRETSRQTFRRYWPLLVGRQTENGVASAFQWADVQFFLLDNQWQRTPAADDPTHGQLLGPDQLRWLTESLAASKATFKVVCVGGQVLNPAGPAGTYAQYGQERAELLARLAATRVPGVVFLTGGRSHAELSRLNRSGLYPLYDFTTAPLTAPPTQDARSERNPLRDSATFCAERNFALLDVAGAAKDRTLTLTLCGADGRAIWKRTLRAADLQPGATPSAPVRPTTPDSATANGMAVPPAALTRTTGAAKTVRLRTVRRRHPRGAAPRSAPRFSAHDTLRVKK